MDLKKNNLREFLKFCNTKEKAIISLMYSSGMNAEEICNLTYFDFLSSVAEYCKDGDVNPFNLGEICLKIRGRTDIIGTFDRLNAKTDFPFVTYCTVDCMQQIMDWLYLVHGPLGSNVDEPLFFSNDGKKITTEDITSIFKRISYESGIIIQPIDLKRLFVEILISAGVLIDTIMFSLGFEFNPALLDNYTMDKWFLKSVYMNASLDLNIVQPMDLRMVDSHLCELEDLSINCGYYPN